MTIRKIDTTLGKTYVEMYVDAVSVYAVEDLLESCNSDTNSFEIVFQSRIRDWCDYDAGYEYKYVDVERTEDEAGEIGWVLRAEVSRRADIKTIVFSRDQLNSVSAYVERSGGYIDCVDYLLRRVSKKAITYSYIGSDKTFMYDTPFKPYIRVSCVTL